MPLPFLQDERQSSATGSAMRTPDSEEDHALMSAASDILAAIESKNVKNLMISLRAAFDILDASPHVEGPHLGEDE